MGCGGSKGATVVETSNEPVKDSVVGKDAKIRANIETNVVKSVPVDGQNESPEAKRDQQRDHNTVVQDKNINNKDKEKEKDRGNRLIVDENPNHNRGFEKPKKDKERDKVVVNPKKTSLKSTSKIDNKEDKDNRTAIDASSKQTRPVQKQNKGTSSRGLPPAKLSSSQDQDTTFGEFSASPFDPSVNVGKYRQEPIPVFGRDAFKLSKGKPDVIIEDTFWEGKRALIPDYSKMRRLDKHAIEAPANIRSSLDKLIPYLLQVAKTDLEKLRVVFRWCAHNIKYNVSKFKTGDRGDNSVQGVLDSGVAVCEGYSVLMVEMCKRAGIECEKMSGHCKGSGYEPGLKDLSTVSHAWNRVTINGQKFFCDCTWAAGSVGVENGVHVFSRHWKEQQFLADPQGFTGQHLTRNLEHQDCPRPYKSVEEWNNEPVIALSARFAGLKCLTHKRGVIHPQSNEVLIKFKLDRALYRSFCILEKENGSKVTDAVQHWWNKDEMSCKVTLPKAGKYGFMLLGGFTRRGTDNKDKDVDWFPADVSEATQNVLVSYTINATGKKVTKLPSFYKNNLFGAPLDLPEAGLIPAAENQGIIKAPNGVAHVVFQKVGQGPSKVNTKLVSFGDDQKELSTAIYCEQFGKWVVCHIRCPTAGKFALSLFVNGNADEISYFVQYAIESEGNVKLREIPAIHGLAGPQSNFEHLGLKLKDSLSSTIVTQNGDGSLVVSWNTAKKLQLICDLKDAAGSKSITEDGCVISESETGNPLSTTTFSIRLKEKGLFKLALFGKDDSMSDKLFLGHWLVVCNKASDKDPYPLRASVLGPRENFHSLGLETTTGSRIICKEGEAVMVVSSQLESQTVFTFSLSRTNDEERKGQIFADTITTSKQRVTTFNFRIKTSGSYALRLFARQNGAEKGPYVGVWHIVCDVASMKPAFPGKHDGYGPNNIFRYSGLQVDEATSKKLTLTAGEGELRITHKPGTNCAMTVRLETEKGNYERTKVSTLIEREWSDKGQVITTRLRIRIQDPGLYDLVVFAKKDGGAQYSYAGVWLVECAAPSKKPQFPETNGSMGPDENFFKMGLSLVNPRCSTIKPSKDGVCILSVRRDKPFETIFKDVNKECNIAKEVTSNGKHVVTCTVRLPRAGLFGLNMFASEPGVNTKNYMGRWLLEWDK